MILGMALFYTDLLALKMGVADIGFSKFQTGLANCCCRRRGDDLVCGVVGVAGRTRVSTG